MTNPLLNTQYLPKFSSIQPSDVSSALTMVLNEAEQQILTLEDVVNSKQKTSWDNFAAPLENIEESIDRVWSTVSHLNAVNDSKELRKAYQEGLQALTEFHTQLGQNQTIFSGYQHIQNSTEFEQLSTAQKKIINNSIRDFRLSGAELSGDKKSQYTSIALELSELSNQFSQNILDATQNWHLLITNPEELTGLPQDVLERAAQGDAEWKFGLDAPTYIAVMQYADNAKIRESFYEAYATRASDVGPDAGKFDNTQLITKIVELKQQKAALLGYKNYAELALTTKMADSAIEVIEFIRELEHYAKPRAQEELAELQTFAKEQYSIDHLDPWDIAYYSEKQKQQEFAFSAEEVKQYFPASHVIQGLFGVVKKLFNIDVKPNEKAETWHDDVMVFDVINDQGSLFGQFYADIYVRKNKRGGAWMGTCRHHRQTEGSQQIPVAYLTCNFAPATDEKPALLSHDDVETLFHEFGHTLHHLLTQVNEMSVAGINGVAWDAVELPSQFLENWCWHPESIELISQHYLTGDALPAELLDKMLRAKHFQSGMQTLRQLEFSLFDMRLHHDHIINGKISVQDLLDEIRSTIAVIQPPSYHRFQNSFSHIFAGGYAAGYYSYKWSEVLSADAFNRFEEEGIFNQETGQSFLENILAKGGEEEPKVLFENFRGRPPSIQPLLTHSGLL